MKRFNFLFFALFLLFARNSYAVDITAHIKVDNNYLLYDSTNDSEAGEYIGTWTWAAGADAWAWDIEPDNKTHYLHILGLDVGVKAGFLGNFSLDTNSPYVFQNGTKYLTTNTKDWTVRKDSWDGTPLQITWAGDNDGHNGDAPWGLYSEIDLNATWIWTNYGLDVGVSGNPAARYFSTKIIPTPVIPEPSSSLLLGLGLFGGVLYKKKNKL